MNLALPIFLITLLLQNHTKRQGATLYHAAALVICSMRTLVEGGICRATISTPTLCHTYFLQVSRTVLHYFDKWIVSHSMSITKMVGITGMIWQRITFFPGTRVGLLHYLTGRDFIEGEIICWSHSLNGPLQAGPPYLMVHQGVSSTNLWRSAVTRIPKEVLVRVKLIVTPLYASFSTRVDDELM